MSKMIPEKSPIDFLLNLDGVFFLDAPMPPRRHRCKRQTTARLANGTIHRCACGALKIGVLGFWQCKNTRILTKESS